MNTQYTGQKLHGINSGIAYITYGQALHLVRTTPVEVSALEQTAQVNGMHLIEGKATLRFLSPKMHYFAVGIEFTADTETNQLTGVTVGHGDDQSLFITVSQKEIDLNFPYVKAVEEFEDKQVIGAIETQSLLIDCSPFVTQAIINKIKEQQIFTIDDFLNEQPTLEHQGRTLIHFKGCLWVSKTLKDDHYGNLYVQQDDNNFRVLAYLTDVEVKKRGLTPLIEATVVANGSGYMLDEKYKRLKGQLHTFADEEIAEYIQLSEEELQHEYLCAENAYENTDHEDLRPYKRKLDVIFHVANMNKFNIV